VANQQVVKREGVGSIRIRSTVNGRTFLKEIQHVWHVPSFAHSLLSTQQLKRAGCWYTSGKRGDMDDYFFDSDDQLWLISTPDGDLNAPVWDVVVNTVLDKPVGVSVDATVAKPTYVGTATFASIDASTNTVSYDHPEPTAFYATPTHAADRETAALWHQRLGHVNVHALQTLVRNKRIAGVNVPAARFHKLCKETCEVCVMAKHNHSPYRPKTHRARHVMYVLHSDICGPYPVTSL